MSTAQLLAGTSGWSYADWIARIRGYLAQDVTVFAIARNHYQGHGPAMARALLSRLATLVPVP